jgi:uncharacterized membrane protein
MHLLVILLSILVVILSIFNLTRICDTPRTFEKVLSYISLGVSTLLISYSSFSIYKKSLQINQFEELLQF